MRFAVQGRCHTYDGMDTSDPPSGRLRRTHLEFIQFAFQCLNEYLLLRDLPKAVKIKTEKVRAVSKRVATFCLNGIKYEVSEFRPADYPEGHVHRSWHAQGHWLLHLKDCTHVRETLVIEFSVLEFQATWPDLPVFNVEEHGDFFLKDTVRDLVPADFEAVLEAFRTGAEASWSNLCNIV